MFQSVLGIWVVGVLALNVLMGGYLLVQFSVALYDKRMLPFWTGGYAAATLMFVIGLATIFQGGILLLGGNLILLGYTIFRQRQALTVHTSGTHISDEDV